MFDTVVSVLFLAIVIGAIALYLSIGFYKDGWSISELAVLWVIMIGGMIVIMSVNEESLRNMCLGLWVIFVFSFAIRWFEQYRKG
jgi:hypothetical protein|tara:strand:+ start:114 stop:368 length:255 start_codon:yes stop_codon:yes gene_type:complete